MAEKKKFTDHVENFANAIAGPIGKLADKPVMRAIQGGLMGAMPVITIGSLFLVLYVLGSPSVGTSGKALLPFLTPLAGKFAWMNSVTLGIMALYCSLTIGQNYAEQLGIDPKSSGVLGLASFIILTVGGNDEAGGFLVSNWSASGLFVCMVSTLLMVKIYSIFLKKGFTIKMPDSVPPTIGNSFAALVPYAVCFTIGWLVRTVFEIDLVAVVMGLLSPLISGVENVFFCTFVEFLQSLLWSVGLHGDNMIGAFVTPFGTMWLEENAAALASGVSNTALPHVLASFPSGLGRLTMWTSSVWPVVVFMFMSKVKYHKTLAATALPAAIFTIVEPVMFGLPLCLNAVLMVPFILSNVIASTVGYLLMSLPSFGKFFASIPWATPPFLLGPLGTGDWKSVIIVVVSFAIGFVIYLPFWRIYERNCLEEEKANEAANAQ